MHRNYYLFERQVTFLNKQLSGTRIRRCFSHRKNELVLQMETDPITLLRIGIDIRIPYILLYDQQNSRDPRIHLFEQLNDQTIRSIDIIRFDKMVELHTDEYLMQIRFYGKSANIHLLDTSGQVMNIFKKKNTPENSSDIRAQIHPDKPDPDITHQLRTENPTMNLEKYLAMYMGGFNNTLALEVCHRAEKPPITKLVTLSPKDWQVLDTKTTQLYHELQQGTARIYDCPGYGYLISIIELSHLGNTCSYTEFESVNAAWIFFIQKGQRTAEFDKLYNQVIGSLKKRIAYLERTLAKIADAESLEERKKEAELKGHLLQTFAHKIRKGESRVMLKNIFSDKSGQIEIKLNPAKSVHENAQKYFEKFKNISEQKEQLIVKKDTFNNELEFWKKLLAKTETTRSIKEIERSYQTLVEKNLIQDQNVRPSDRESLAFSFNRLLLGNKWEVFIGKNAANNDLLTFKFARKFDLWFHAQGVTGSHLIIRLPDRTQHPPVKIIEQAASIAAYNSSAQHSSTVPVNYTEVRYVRKPRKAAPGTVVVANAKTIFVKPVKLF